MVYEKAPAVCYPKFLTQARSQRSEGFARGDLASHGLAPWRENPDLHVDSCKFATDLLLTNLPVLCATCRPATTVFPLQPPALLTCPGDLYSALA